MVSLEPLLLYFIKFSAQYQVDFELMIIFEAVHRFGL